MTTRQRFPSTTLDRRWAFPRLWLVVGPKGRHWCMAVGRRGAQTVYRHIPWEGSREYTMVVHEPGRLELAEGAVFWHKEPQKESEALRWHSNGRHEPAPDSWTHVELPPSSSVRQKTPRD